MTVETTTVTTEWLTQLFGSLFTMFVAATLCQEATLSRAPSTDGSLTKDACHRSPRHSISPRQYCSARHAKVVEKLVSFAFYRRLYYCRSSENAFVTWHSTEGISQLKQFYCRPVTAIGEDMLDRYALIDCKNVRISFK